MSSKATEQVGSKATEQAVAKPNGKPRIGGPTWAGKQVGRFRLISELGRGAMGRVIRAEDTLLHRQIALKVLPKVVRRGNRTIAVERLISEARAAATLDHPHIVTIYEVNESGGVFYIAMELLEGGSLRDLVKAAGPMDYTRACLLCADAADGLAQAHSMGIIHRDVKPANLMLTRSGRCKVVDFGLARTDDSGDLGVALPESVGTPQFIAPELLKGATASARSDLYSLGATLWFLLTGHPPFQAGSSSELLRMHLEAPLPDLSALRPDLPPGLCQAVAKAMAKVPGDRFDSVAQFEKVLRVYTIPAEHSTSASLSGIMDVNEPTMPAPPSYELTAPKWRPSPMLLAAAGGGALLLILLRVLMVKMMGPSKTNDSTPPLGASASAAAAPHQASPSAEPQQLPITSLPQLPDDARVVAARAKQLANRGQFVQGANEYAKAIQLDPNETWNWYYRGCLLAYLGQQDAYRATCQGMYDRFATSSDATRRDKTAKTCCLLENSGIKPSDLVSLANSLPADGGNNNADLGAWFNLCRALALYRDGQYDSSIEMARNATTPDRVPRAMTAQLVEAMAQWRKGMRSEAKSTLRQAIERMDQTLPRAGEGDLDTTGIENWLACQTIRKQAEKLIGR